MTDAVAADVLRAFVERIERWLKVLGPIMGPGRANPDNDMQYLLLDAAECIRGLRQYARHLEDKA